MEDNADGLHLPSFSGRISEDWELHESNLKSWLFVRGIPLHSEESARILSLSLKDSAAIAYQNNTPESAFERTRFDVAIASCRELWNDPVRKALKKNTATIELGSRKFRQRGKRTENIKHLIDDLERLLYCVGVETDKQKQTILTNATLDFPDLFAKLTLAHSYQDAIHQAIEWEYAIVQREEVTDMQRLRILNQGLQSYQPATNPMHPTNSSVSQPSARRGVESPQQAAHTEDVTESTPVQSTNAATSQPTPAPLSPDTTSPSGHAYDSGDEEEDEEREELLDSTSFEAVSPHEETRNTPREASTGSTSLPFAAPTPSPHFADSNLSGVDTLSPTHSTPIHHGKSTRPFHSRPALPSFDSPEQPSFSHSHLRPISHHRSQSIDFNPNRAPTPSFVAEATAPLFASHPRTSFDHYQPPRPSTSQSLYSRAPLPPISPSSIQKTRSVLRKPSHSQHSRSLSQPSFNTTTSSSTISRSSSLLDTIFRRNRKPKLDQSNSISRLSMCLTPDSTNQYTTSDWSTQGQVGGKGEVSFGRSFDGGEGEDSFERKGNEGRAPKQRGNGLNGLPP